MELSAQRSKSLRNSEEDTMEWAGGHCPTDLSNPEIGVKWEKFPPPRPENRRQHVVMETPYCSALSLSGYRLHTGPRVPVLSSF
jgi:hypothetical protein